MSRLMTQDRGNVKGYVASLSVAETYTQNQLQFPRTVEGIFGVIGVGDEWYRVARIRKRRTTTPHKIGQKRSGPL
jgi:hypothetical protein